MIGTIRTNMPWITDTESMAGIFNDISLKNTHILDAMCGGRGVNWIFYKNMAQL